MKQPQPRGVRDLDTGDNLGYRDKQRGWRPPTRILFHVESPLTRPNRAFPPPPNVRDLGDRRRTALISGVVPMTPILGTRGEHLLYLTHRCSAIVLTIAVAIQVVALFRRRK